MGARCSNVVRKYPVYHPLISTKSKVSLKALYHDLKPNHPIAIGNKVSILPQRNSIFNYAYPRYWWQWTDWSSRHR